MSSRQEKPKNPNFCPDSEEWMSNFADKVAKANTRSKHASVASRYTEDPVLDAGRLGTAANFKHERRELAAEDARLRCIVCCCKCTSHSDSAHIHSRIGFKVGTQCSTCMVPLCDKKRRFSDSHLSCWDIWHLAMKEDFPRHGSFVRPDVPTSKKVTPARAQINAKKRRTSVAKRASSRQKSSERSTVSSSQSESSSKKRRKSDSA